MDTGSTGGRGPRTVVVCDGRAVFADALAAALPQHGFAVAATAASTTGCAVALRRHSPDLCLLAEALTGARAAVGALAHGHPGTRLVMLGTDPGREVAAQVLREGAAGYVRETAGLGALTAALRQAAGGVVVPAQRPDGPHRLAAHLTPRERECLALLVDGASTEAMRARLGVSTTTVRTHVQALLVKLGVHSRLEAASLAVRHDLLADG